MSTQEKPEGEKNTKAEPNTMPGPPIKTKTVVVLSPCIVEGKQVEPGTEITLPEAQANLLIGDGMAQSQEDAAKAKEEAAAAEKSAEHSGGPAQVSSEHAAEHGKHDPSKKH
jgi:hypothetical protein